MAGTVDRDEVLEALLSETPIASVVQVAASRAARRPADHAGRVVAVRRTHSRYQRQRTASQAGLAIQHP